MQANNQRLQSDGGNGTEEVSIVVNENDLITVKFNSLSCSVRGFRSNRRLSSLENDFGLAVSAKLTDADKFRFLT